FSPIQGVGHADLVQTASGSWFAVALAFRPKGYPPCHHLGRETFLCPVTWPDNDFPQFGADGRLELEHEPSLCGESPPGGASRDECEQRELAVAWNYMGAPDPSRYSLSERPGYLRLWGAPPGLDDAASPTWLGQRQRHFDVRVSAAIDFHPSTEREEAGVVV